MSALCKAVAPAQVQISFADQEPLSFRVAWRSDAGPVSFAGESPDDAADRALATLRGRLSPASLGAHKTLARVSQCTSSASTPASEPLAQAGWIEAMRERIQDIEVGRAHEQPRQAESDGLRPVRRPTLRLVHAV